ncbi:hypothetical protein [Solirubrum puertoriconensis]|uniref:STAS/SEC14 domain-containing protein n=1 Tax=Solirubrum puertoriconensis TaxID=1751427 RepID=A0A9X0HPK5_SOLP1|nr:hypothetical protein [Solirubrum puertoriconensis]KUG09855.1 hypothetical protein ASU33_19505 [Solirubrum puertoriconensis]
MNLHHQAKFTNAIAEVWPDPAGYAVLRWKAGFRPFTAFMEAMNALLCQIRSLGTGKTMAILTNMEPISQEEKHWILTHWLPRAVVQGQCRYAALVNPPEQIDWQGEVTTRFYTSLPPDYAIFTDETAAHKWLQEQIVIQSRY